MGIVAEKAHSNFVAAVTGTVPRAPDCVGGGLGEPSPAPHPKLLGPAFQTGGAFFLHRAAEEGEKLRRSSAAVATSREGHRWGWVAARDQT